MKLLLKLSLVISLLLVVSSSYISTNYERTIDKPNIEHADYCSLDAVIDQQLQISYEIGRIDRDQYYSQGDSQGYYSVSYGQLIDTSFDPVRLVRTGLHPGDPTAEKWQICKLTNALNQAYKNHRNKGKQPERDNHWQLTDIYLYSGQRADIPILEATRHYYSQNYSATSERDQTALEQMAKVPIVVGKDLLTAHNPVYRC